MKKQFAKWMFLICLTLLFVTAYTCYAETDYKGAVTRFIEANTPPQQKTVFEARTVLATDSPNWKAVVVYFKQGHTKQPQALFVSADGKTIVPGMVFIDNKPIISRDKLAFKPEYEKVDYKFTEEQREIINLSGTKKVLLFTDPECPYCQRLENALKNYHGEYKIVIKNFPLPMHGEKAMKGAIERQSKWLVKNGMPQEEADKKAKEMVAKDIAEGIAAEVSGTPTIISDTGDIETQDIFKN
ncbi:MAG: thioredoxin fold domain-containing protein [Dissulfurispiraceae bacterium]|jgi:thioredoxin-related protein